VERPFEDEIGQVAPAERDQREKADQKAIAVGDRGLEAQRGSLLQPSRRQTINDFLPADTQEEIGMLVSFSAMEAALKREIRTPELGSEIENLLSECPDFRMAQLEDRLLTRRQARGLEHGGELLVHFVERINQPIKTWIELDRRNRGGRPTKNVARDFLLFRLAEAAPAVIGRRPTATAGGRFVGRGRRLRIRSSGDRAGGGKSDKGAVQATTEGLQKDS